MYTSCCVELGPAEVGQAVDLPAHLDRPVAVAREVEIGAPAPDTDIGTTVADLGRRPQLTIRPGCGDLHEPT
jgi:hypothetical protein